MKKAFLVFFMLGVIVYSQAQTGTTGVTTSTADAGSGDCLKSKKGCTVLPESGDWALGIDATPIFNLVGNLIKINSGAAFTDPSSFNFMDGTNAIYGKYFTDEHTAYRGKLRIGINDTKNGFFVDDLTSSSIPRAQVEDISNTLSSNIIIGGGIEKHKGKSRIQGFYGGEALIIYSTSRTKYTYGNPTSSINPIASNSFNPAMNGVVLNKSGKTFGIGARGFVGVEYFFAPKVCIGGEFGWGIDFTSTGDGTQEKEEWNSADQIVRTTTVETAGGSVFNMDTDNFGGSIYLLFHF